ncbi:Flp family type IVb pilin [Teichococcus oryzae]|uniref:Flp family type IVb pilin n=1 Tax=Teichococcus oryzae TaxID=1608942 RepID=A0A5B2T9K7_9PROT|nr:Flp family type IVb pilin [Pseudoroseomonas oryzae]KAA2211301.1 Flp family type IVb pilin [Pseudoroseomonas oryzae]
MMGKALYLLASLKADRKGVTALEYGVIAAVIVVAVAGAMSTFGTEIGTFFTGIIAKITAAGKIT